jgi:hypothetical protein
MAPCYYAIRDQTLTLLCRARRQFCRLRRHPQVLMLSDAHNATLPSLARMQKATSGDISGTSMPWSEKLYTGVRFLDATRHSLAKTPS